MIESAFVIPTGVFMDTEAMRHRRRGRSNLCSNLGAAQRRSMPVIRARSGVAYGA
jgi:hypothetical protein